VGRRELMTALVAELEATGRAAEVECQQCGARHCYRAPSGVARERSAGSAPKPSATPRGRLIGERQPVFSSAS
jgi:hypothetical protein